MKNWKDFINENNEYHYDIGDKLKLLKSYIHILNNSDKYVENYDIAINYFIIIHNFLIIERMFFEEVKLCNKEINKNLKLEKLNNCDDVYKKFLELYDNNHTIKFSVETLDSIESVRIYLSNRPEVYKKLIKK